MSSHHRYTASLDTHREFKGAGPVLSWEASKRLLGDEEVGHVDVDWSIAGAALFGKQMTTITGEEQSGYWSGLYRDPVRILTDVVKTPVNVHRTKSVTVPVVDLSVGVSYEIQRVKVSTGYRWERYFNAIDGGYAEHKSFDRTLDGPYVKLSVGFGG